jgi:hypothetical protein
MIYLSKSHMLTFTTVELYFRRHDTQQNDTQHNDIQHNNVRPSNK